MKYIIAILVLVIIFGLYVIGYIFNSRIEKPKNCKYIECEGCVFNCNKRSDTDGSIH